MRRDPPRALLGQQQALALDTRQSADSRADRDAGAQPHGLVHLGQTSILQRLAGGVEAVDDEGVDLPLDLVIDPLAGVEAKVVVDRLNFAGDPAFLVAGVEFRDRPGAALSGDQISPTGLDVPAQRRNKTQTGNNDAAHRRTPLTTNGPPN